MIDIENKIFNDIATQVQLYFSDASIYSDAIDVPASFPCVTIQEIDNSVYERSSDSSALENHARLTYEFNIYSNLQSGKKSQAKDIQGIIDSVMEDFNFTRTFCSPMPNQDRTIYRIVSRYDGIVAKGVENNGNTRYTIYRK